MSVNFDAYLTLYNEKVDAKIKRAEDKIAKYTEKSVKRDELYPILKQQASDLGVGDLFNQIFFEDGRYNLAAYRILMGSLVNAADKKFKTQLQEYIKKYVNVDSRLKRAKYNLVKANEMKDRGAVWLISLANTAISNAINKYITYKGGDIDYDTAYKEIFGKFKADDWSDFMNYDIISYFTDESQKQDWLNKPRGIVTKPEFYNIYIETYNNKELVKYVPEVKETEIKEPEVEEEHKEEVTPINETEKVEEESGGTPINLEEIVKEEPITEETVESKPLELEKEKVESVAEVKKEKPKEEGATETIINEGDQISNFKQHFMSGNLSAGINELAESQYDKMMESKKLEEASQLVEESKKPEVKEEVPSSVSAGINELAESQYDKMMESKKPEEASQLVEESKKPEVKEEVPSSVSEPTKESSKKSKLSPMKRLINKWNEIREEPFISKEISNFFDNSIYSKALSFLGGTTGKSFSNYFSSINAGDNIFNKKNVTEGSSELNQLTTESKNMSVNEQINEGDISNMYNRSLSSQAIDNSLEVSKSKIGIDKSIAPLNIPQTKSETKEEVSMTEISKPTEEAAAPSKEIKKETSSTTNVTNETTNRSGKNINMTDTSQLEKRLKRIENILMGGIEVKIVD